MIALKIILIPFSLIYSLIIFIRNKLYDFKIFRSHKISKPVISIGNITTGGTGKTPLTIFIAKYFLEKHLKVGIVSRGYKRKTDKIVIVSNGVCINNNIEDCGDELILISNELIKDNKNNFFSAAGSDRVETANLLIDMFDPDIIILDDGFQNRRIQRDLDVVIIDATNYFTDILGNTFTLPSGHLRETFAGMRRADLIMQNNKSDNFEIINSLLKYDKEILIMRYKTEYFMDNKNGILENQKTDAIVFSGIANDYSFNKMIKDSGINIIEKMNFPDHHHYTIEDINFLKNRFTNGSVFITTEKDFIKIKNFNEFISEYHVYFLKLEIEIATKKNILFNKLNELVN